MEYQLVIDCWEGNLEIDEAVLQENDIAGIIPRLNDMNGGHHMDQNFARQWAEAEAFFRIPYFVYNPWVSGRENFNWLMAHIPADAHRFSADIEVRKLLYSPTTYAREVDWFHQATLDRFGASIIYTGEWFLQVIAYWPRDAIYWWAQYPFVLQPPQTTYATWDDIREIIRANNLVAPFNVSKIPGPWGLWQCSGDKYILPGNPGHWLDINIFPGTKAELAAFMGYDSPPNPPPPGGTMFAYSVTPISAANVNVRATHAAGSTPTVGKLPVGKSAYGNEIWNNPANSDRWLHVLEVNGLPLDGWVAVMYNGSPITKLANLTPPPATDTVTLTTLEVEVDGAVYVNPDPVALHKRTL